jgi:uncharacterized RDD family membrane protein YckC
VDASAAQNLPVTKTCSQCGAVLPSSARVCHFCDSSFSVGSSAFETSSDLHAQSNLARNAAPETTPEAAWQGELAQRLKAYRTRRRKPAAHDNQSHFAFEENLPIETAANSVAVAEPCAPAEEDFSFTIAIGRPSERQIREKSPMEIDVSLRPETETPSRESFVTAGTAPQPGLFPVALMEDRRMAGVVDLFCLLFAYGGFLGLFGSLGGHFTLSKLSVAVCVATFSVVYLQYFALFTIFGGTTPGMMMRGLRVLSFSGDTPSPKQMLLRSAGYLLSAGAFFLGYLWAMWDEDELTWHDRLSSTYLSAEQTLADFEASGAAHSR